MDRRKFLVTTAMALSVPLVGCLDAATADGNGPTERPWTPSYPTDGPSGVHDLLVENHTDSTEAAWLRVVREDGATLVDGRYELPDGRGIEFEDVAAWATTYTIDLAIDGRDVTSFEWYTDECGPDAEAPEDGGSRNAAVRVEAASDDGGERVSLVVDQCDAIVAGTVPTGPAEAFRLDG